MEESVENLTTAQGVISFTRVRKQGDKHQDLCNGKKEIEFLPREKNTGEVPKMKGNTKLIQEHHASCWGCLLLNPDEVEYFDCYSQNPSRGFVKELIRRAVKLFENYWEPVIRTNLKSYDIDDIPMDEIINDEDIDFSCRYYLRNIKNWREGEMESNSLFSV